MKRTFFAAAISILMTTVPMAAQHGGGAPKPTAPHGVKAPATHATQAPKTTTHATAPHGGSTSHGTQGPKTTTHGAPAPKTTSHATQMHGASTAHGSSAVKPAKTTHEGHAATKTTTHGSSASTTTSKTAKTTTKAERTKTTTTAPTTTSTTGTTTTTLTPVQQKLQKNTNLASKLQSRLPAGTDLNLASAGFRNLGQFVAAVNVSSNLGIPFAQLKTRMVDQGMSLGQAIQDARPATADTTVVAHRAETDADSMIRTSEQTTATKTKIKKPAKTTRGDR